MALASNIVRRAGSAKYYARIAVPKDLRPILNNRREFWKSLNTSDPRQARERASGVVARWHAEFAELRKRRTPTAADLQSLVWEQYQATLERDRLERLHMPIQADIDKAKNHLTADILAGKIEWSEDPAVQLNAAIDLHVMQTAAKTKRHAAEVRLKTLVQHLISGEIALVADDAKHLILKHGLLVEPNSSEFRDICQRLIRAEIEAHYRIQERDQGEWTGTPKDILVAPPDDAYANKTAAPGESLMELYDRFAREQSASATPETWRQSRIIVKLFSEFIGENAHVSAVTRKAVRDWKHKLALWPMKAADMKVFAGMSFRKIIEKNEIEKKPVISQKTINKYLSALGSFCGWLLANDYIDQDVMRRMYLAVDKKAKTRLPFSHDQLNKIFGSPLFHSCRGDTLEHLPGNIQIRDWRYWLPWIALYTGARLGEIAQLAVDDVRQIHGIWVIHVTREGATYKTTKTEGSQRVIPVHSALARLGFIDYCNTQRAAGNAQLFPEIKPDARGFYSGEPSKWFAKYFREIDVKTDNKVNFHSFRHGIADAFRRAGYLDEQFGFLLGHGKATTTGRYGIMPEGILSERVRIIESVSYPLVSTVSRLSG